MYTEALCAAFWTTVRRELEEGDAETRLWLDTGEEVGGFLWWAELSNLDATYLRTRFLALYTGLPSSALLSRTMPSGKAG